MVNIWEDMELFIWDTTWDDIWDNIWDTIDEMLGFNRRTRDITLVPSGKPTVCYWQWPFNSLIYPLNVVIFHRYVNIYQKGVCETVKPSRTGLQEKCEELAARDTTTTTTTTTSTQVGTGRCGNTKYGDTMRIWSGYSGHIMFDELTNWDTLEYGRQCACPNKIEMGDLHKQQTGEDLYQTCLVLVLSNSLSQISWVQTSTDQPCPEKQ